MSEFVSREEFLSASKRRFKEVLLPDGRKCRIRSLTEGEYAEIDCGNLDSKGRWSLAGIRTSNARLVAASACDGNGDLLFTAADIDRLAAVDVAWIEPLAMEIKQHCGLIRSQEETRKNSNGTTGEDSPSS